MDVKRVLKELIAVPVQRFPVASVYLDCSRADEHQRQAVRIFVADEVRKALKASPDPDAERLRDTLRPVEGYVAGLLRQRYDDAATGIALFSCAPTGLFRVLATRAPFRPMELHLDRRPCVVPFVRTCASVPPLLIEAIDSEQAHLYEVSCGVVDVEARFERPLPGRFSQRNDSAHHLGEVRDRNLRAAAEPLVKACEAIPDAKVVLAAQSVILNQFESHLPERVRARVVARVPYPQGLSDGALRAALLAQARPALEEALRVRSLALRDEALSRAAARNLGAAGVGEVLLALAEGGVHQLIVDPAYQARGLRCSTCGALATAGASCAFCGAELEPARFPEEIIRRAYDADAEVVVLPEEAGLPHGVGLAALLRHRGSARAAASQGLGSAGP
jgi:hypothetical protein